MKITKNTHPFIPIVIEITIESQLELDSIIEMTQRNVSIEDLIPKIYFTDAKEFLEKIRISLETK